MDPCKSERLSANNVTFATRRDLSTVFFFSNSRPLSIFQTNVMVALRRLWNGFFCGILCTLPVLYSENSNIGGWIDNLI